MLQDLIKAINQHKRLFENFETQLVFIKDTEGRYFFVNSAFQRFFGFDMTMLYEHSIDIFFDSQEQIKRMQDDDALLISGAIKTSTHIVPLKDAKGEIKTLYVKKVAFYHEKKIVGVLGLVDDVTDAKIALDYLFVEHIHKLSGQQRIYFFEMSRRVGKSYTHADMAEVMGISESESRQLKYKIMDKLDLKGQEKTLDSLLVVYHAFIRAIINGDEPSED